MDLTRLTRILIACCCLTSSLNVLADNFNQCRDQLKQAAKDRGYESDRFNSQIDQLKFVPKVIELDRRQPEFSQTFPGYFKRRVSDTRVETGRQRLATHRELLEKLSRQYGVPAQYLVAFWGLETNYGSYLGKMPTLDSLATLACDARRSQFFTDELFEALQLTEMKGIPLPMTGSWAGALGNTQFMPSNYRRFAVDGNGDGIIDLWGSIPDALTSAANFLQHLGWQAGERWGREVRLPDDFDYNLAGQSQRQPLTFWQQQGILTADGHPLPNADMQAAVLLPSGYDGPAFLVYQNFEVIMRWNRSEYYALSVGHLADRINGAGALRQAMPDVPDKISIEHMSQLQQQLTSAGYDTGGVDGILGPATRSAIRQYQLANQLIADGFPRRALFQAFNIDLPPSGS